MSAESKLQTRVVKYARARGLMVKRNVMGPGAEVGWPDVEVFGPGGRVVLIEFKAPGKEPRMNQWYRIRRLRDLGHEVHVCEEYEAAKEIIDAINQPLPH